MGNLEIHTIQNVSLKITFQIRIFMKKTDQKGMKMLFKEQGYYLGWVEEVHHGSSSASPLPARTRLLCQNSVKNDAFHEINESSRLIMEIMNNNHGMRRQQFSSYA